VLVKQALKRRIDSASFFDENIFKIRQLNKNNHSDGAELRSRQDAID
jgi:hypothetical protein